MLMRVFLPVPAGALASGISLASGQADRLPLCSAREVASSAPCTGSRAEADRMAVRHPARNG
ncbi:hypothetical protein RSWS8N_09030 [Cereibacter sphaeroides WS8N]|nr:hypothetical protein RSWS8N_09030 [Cereibacter sphaeroides WS8N]